MTNKMEKTYLILLVVLLIICIVITMYVCQRNNENYTSKVINNKIHIIHATSNLTGNKELSSENLLQDNLNEMAKTHDDEIGLCSLYLLKPSIESVNMKPSDWVRIGDYINSVYDKYDAFIVIHGDNTLDYTASALSFMFENLSKPIVLTTQGSEVQNKNNITWPSLSNSLIYASQLRIPEVVVVYDNKVYRGCCSNPVSSFTPAPLAVMGKDIELNKGIVFSEPTSNMIYKPFNTKIRIIVIKLFPGITGEYISKTLGAYPVQGIVFDLFNNGESPTDKSFLNAIGNLYKKRTLMIGIPESSKSNENNNLGVELKNNGVSECTGMTIEAAVAKLYYIISNTDKFENAIAMMNTSLRGEM